jgi:hypothetical protein
MQKFEFLRQPLLGELAMSRKKERKRRERGEREERGEKFPLALMGVLDLGSSHATPSARAPINMRGNFLPHMSAESASNI